MHAAELKKFARKCLRATPPAASLYNLARAEVTSRRLVAAVQGGGTPTLVYQMGKVGSSTVVRTLEAIPEVSGSVTHVHFLEPGHVREVRTQAIRDAGRLRVGFSPDSK